MTVNTKAVIKILKAPTCIGVSPINDFLINMKELPQIKESANRIIQRN